MASDDFNRTNASGVGALGSNWSEHAGSMRIISQVVYGNGGEYNAISYVGTWANDQSSHYTLAGTGVEMGPATRLSGTSAANFSGYWLSNRPLGLRLRKLVNGSITTIADGLGTAATNGQAIKLDAAGTSLRAYVAGSQVGSTQTDSAVSSGNPGFMTWANSSSEGVDDWIGTGDAGSAVLTGTAIGGITEADLRAGGKTIVVTVTGETFIA